MEAVYGGNIVTNPSAQQGLNGWTRQNVTVEDEKLGKYTKAFLLNTDSSLTQNLSASSTVTELKLAVTAKCRNELPITNNVVPLVVRLDMSVDVTETDIDGNETVTAEFRHAVLPCPLTTEAQEFAATVAFMRPVKIKSATLVVIPQVGSILATGFSVRLLPVVKSLSDQIDDLGEELENGLGIINEDLVSIKQTMNSLSVQVGNVQTGFSNLTMTVNSISASVQSANGKIASITAEVNDLYSSLRLKADRVDIQGMVRFSDLSTAGSTTINGANITTGYISASRIAAGSLSVDKINFASANVGWRQMFFVTDVSLVHGIVTRQLIKFLGAVL